MKFFKKKGVAVTVMVLAIVVAIGIGAANRKDVPNVPTADGKYELDGGSTAGYAQWIMDDAGVLSSATEDMICRYNATWDGRYNSVIAVVTVRTLSGDIADMAYQFGNEMGLGQGDALLLMVTPKSQDSWMSDAYLATGAEFATMLTDSMAGSYMDTYLYQPFMDRDYDTGVLALFNALHVLYVDTFGGNGNYGGGYYAPAGGGAGMVFALFFLILLIVILADGRRYRRYRSGWYGPTYVYRPFLFG